MAHPPAPHCTPLYPIAPLCNLLQPLHPIAPPAPHCTALLPSATRCTPPALHCSPHCHQIAPPVCVPRQVVVDVGLAQEKTLELAPAVQNLSVRVSPYTGAGDGPWSPPILLLACE